MIVGVALIASPYLRELIIISAHALPLRVSLRGNVQRDDPFCLGIYKLLKYEQYTVKVLEEFPHTESSPRKRGSRRSRVHAA